MMFDDFYMSSLLLDDPAVVNNFEFKVLKLFVWMPIEYFIGLPNDLHPRNSVQQKHQWKNIDYQQT